MRIPGAILPLLLLLIGARVDESSNIDSCDIRTIYGSVQAPVGAVALTYFGTIEEIDLVLVPQQLEPGTYRVTATRKARDLYRVNNGSTYVATRSCFRMGVGESATLRVGIGLFGGSTVEWD